MDKGKSILLASIMVAIIPGCSSSTTTTTGSVGGAGGSAASAGASGGTGDTAGGAGSGGASGLTWHFTCGDPVCRNSGYRPKDGVPLCTDQKEGTTCSTQGASCDPKNDCNALLRCDDHPLTTMCPISSRRFKHDIEYLNPSELQQLTDEVRKIQLTRYMYRDPADADRQHLGFIIEDNPQSPAIDQTRDRVDLYSYTSMAIAAVQIQAKQIEELQRQVSALKQQPETNRTSSPGNKDLRLHPSSPVSASSPSFR